MSWWWHWQWRHSHAHPPMDNNCVQFCQRDKAQYHCRGIIPYTIALLKLMSNFTLYGGYKLWQLGCNDCSMVFSLRLSSVLLNTHHSAQIPTALREELATTNGCVVLLSWPSVTIYLWNSKAAVTLGSLHWQGVRGSTMHEGTSFEAVPCINRIGPLSYVRIASPTCQSPLASLLDAVASFAAVLFFCYIASCDIGRSLLHISFVRPHIIHSTLFSQRVGFNTRTSSLHS